VLCAQTSRVLTVLQVMNQLPEGLAVALLTASSADLNHQLDALPVSLHHLAVEAAFPSIRSHHSLTLNFNSTEKLKPGTACAVLHAATLANSALRKLHLSNISLKSNDRLLQVISAACMSSLDVSLSFNVDNVQRRLQQSALAKVSEALSCNTALTVLSLTFGNDPSQIFSLDSLLAVLTGLQSLTLAMNQLTLCCTEHVAASRCIGSLLCLTHLCIGHGFHLMNLPQIMPNMARLQALHLRGDGEPQLQQLPSLSHLTALKTLKLQFWQELECLPLLASLTSLQALHLSYCSVLKRIPPLDSLSALQSIQFLHCRELKQLPSLDSLTALHTLELSGCEQIQHVPSLASLSTLKTFTLRSFQELERLPSLSSLAELQTLKVSCCKQLMELPPLDSLTALQTLELIDCGFQRIPSLASLTALQRLKVTWHRKLLELPPLATLTALQTLDLRGCMLLQQIPPLNTLTALQSINLSHSPQLLLLPTLGCARTVQILKSSRFPLPVARGTQSQTAVHSEQML
jgi:Leucine-rich repeat (LRR) protein